MTIPVPTKKPQSKFKIAPWRGENEGDKILLYGAPGIGKTTLSALAPKPVFIGIDDGGRKREKHEGEAPLNHIEGITDFKSVRLALQQRDLFKDIETIVVDNVTELQRWGLDYTLKTMPTESGKAAKNIESYGWHKGYRHWYDTMRLILQDCDPLVREGKNIIMIAHSSIINKANPGGEEFLKEAPELHHDKNVSILNLYTAWFDHIFLLSQSSLRVKKGKVASTNERAVFVHPEAHFVAESRTLPLEYSIVSFVNPKDDSIWQMIFNGARPKMEK